MERGNWEQVNEGNTWKERSKPANITCPPLSDSADIKPAFNAVDDENKPLAPPKRSLEGLVTLEKQTGGEINSNVSLNLRLMVILFSHTYWTRGWEFVGHNPNTGYYELNNHDYEDRPWDPNAPVPPRLTPAAKHIREL